MGNPWDDMMAAIAQAKTTINASNAHVRDMTDLCVGRLRLGDCHTNTLNKLKIELRDWNIHTGRWKEKK